MKIISTGLTGYHVKQRDSHHSGSRSGDGADYEKSADSIRVNAKETGGNIIKEFPISQPALTDNYVPGALLDINI